MCKYLTVFGYLLLVRAKCSERNITSKLNSYVRAFQERA